MDLASSPSDSRKERLFVPRTLYGIVRFEYWIVACRATAIVVREYPVLAVLVLAIVLQYKDLRG